jgi:hypothetical protein
VSSEAAVQAPAPGALGKHEELPDNGSEGCVCAPVHVRLRSEHGELVQPRGKSVNRCSYCAKLAAVENCEMLTLDALAGDAPRIIAILGTRTATVDMGAFQAGKDHLVKAIRRRWPDAEYACQVEFTTGYGPRSGGLRRPHWNWFWKGIPEGDVEEFAALNRRIWCRHVDALPERQYVAPIDNAVGLTKYVTQHFMKASQSPPPSFTGQRFNCSVGYFGHLTRAQARAQAREALALKRELYKLGQVIDDAHELELAAHLAVKRNASTRWVLTTASGARLSPTVLAGELVDRLVAGSSLPPRGAP